MNYFFSYKSKLSLDRIADLISEAVVDNHLKKYGEARVEVDSILSNGIILLSGNVQSSEDVNYQKVVKGVLKNLNLNSTKYLYNSKSTSILSNIVSFNPSISHDIQPFVDNPFGEGSAYGYACNDNKYFMQNSALLGKMLIKEIDQYFINNTSEYYQIQNVEVKVDFKENDHVSIKVNVPFASNNKKESYQPDTEIMDLFYQLLFPKVLERFPALDIKRNTSVEIFPVDNQSSNGENGISGRSPLIHQTHMLNSETLSGRDPYKISRIASFAARYIAKNLVAAGVSERVGVQLVYQRFKNQPIIVNINTYNTSKIKLNDDEISSEIKKLFDLSPYYLLEKFKMNQQSYFDLLMKEIITEPSSDQYLWESTDSKKLIQKHFSID